MAGKKMRPAGKTRLVSAVMVAAIVCLCGMVCTDRARAQPATTARPSQDEVASLLAIKAAFGNPATLSSWNDSGAGACLTWVGIRCSDTGRVVSLALPRRGLTGPLADDVGNLTSLRKISLHDNAITGPIPQSLGTLPAMRSVALFINRFAGNVPSNLGNSSTLEALDLSFNQLSGEIPRGVVQSPRLYLLDFSFNFLWGGFPNEWTASQSLTDIVLAGNFLSGTLPDQWGSFNAGAYVTATPPVQLQRIDLQGNRFSGNIPRTFGNLGNLKLLHLGNNAMSGIIPVELTRLRLLESLDFSNNTLTGSLPAEFARLAVLTFADFSGNSLTGGVPSGLGATNLSVLHLGDNSLKGGIPGELSKLTHLLSLNVSNNQLSGSVPPSLWELNKLKILALGHNGLTGNILEDIGNMMSLSSLDLSYNNFSGELPLSVIDLTNLASLNVSYNNFSGPIPPFAHPFSNSAFLGNPGLCGRSPFSACPEVLSPTPSPEVVGSTGTAPAAGGTKHHRFSMVTIIPIALGSALGSLAVICVCLLILWKKKGDKKSRFVRRSVGAAVRAEKNGDGAQDSEELGGKLVHFDGPMAFSADHLLCATAEVLGKSSYGTVYKATLEDTNIIAVKRLREGIVKGQKEFESEVGTLGKIRHPNLLALRAYYWGPKDEKLLVFDYMACGSLAAFLHARGPETPLNWGTRMNIAVGAAKGLGYLHDCQNIIHGNLTASNILLDARMNSKISDYGLSRLMTPQAMQVLMATAGMPGYRAPELATTKKATAKSDVYSFGITLLELLTGKAPIEQSASGTGMDLAEWVSSVVKEEWTSEVFDVEIIKDAPHHQEEEMYNALHLAMVCVTTAPTARPEMEDVVRQLEEIRPDLRSSPESAALSGTDAKKDP